MKNRFASIAWSKAIEVCVSLAALLIVGPVVFLLVYGAPGVLLLAANIMAVAVGALLLLLLASETLEERRDNARYRALNDRDLRWQTLYRGAFVMTPHRLEILRKHGVSDDVVDDLKKIADQFGSGNVDGSQFFPAVETALGTARFRDERETIRYVHDATRTIAELEAVSKE